MKNSFDSLYRSKCLNAYKFESFTVRHIEREYHYTLYYYDQGGNLVKTVPPAGVTPNFNTSFLDSVKNARATGSVKIPSHTLITQYRYNTLNQVVAQKSPDGGQAAFWYDRLGRLAISQNAKQKAASGSESGRQYSYTQYDGIGRITEVGQLSNAGSTTMTDSISRSQSILSSWITASASNKQMITQTIYDTAYTGFTGYSPKPIVQHNLRNRVAYTSYTTGNNPINYNQGSFFTYDIEGNVDTLVQDYGNGSITASKNMMNTSGNRFKQMIYRYDLVSGKVTDVGYQMHYPDQFYHHYDYDSENRLVDAQTSTDSVYWETDARYSYYKHGPLARTVLGEQQIQGIDYAYTLQGWLKGVNSSSLNAAFDIGLDGDTASSNPNKYVAADQYGFNLNYFTGDYKPISSSLVPFPGVSAKLNNEYRPLYNGNISSMAVNLGPLYPGYAEQIWEGPLLYNYTYDQLNRLTAMKAYYGLNETTNVWDTVAYTPSYHEKVTYDPNGNINKYIRNNGHYAAGTTDGAPMDSLFYNYNAGTNQLNQVRDLVTAWPAGYYYLHDQPVNNYTYDGIGNIIKDSIQSLSKIVWNVYGKITEIDHASPPTWNESKTIYYYYDASGNRIGKKVTQGNNKNANYSWYVRDASGNVMSSYTMTGDSTVAQSTLTLNQEYHYMYGSARLGMHSVFSAVNAADNGTSAYTVPWAGQYYGWRRSKKYYELTNHLGNVMMTLSDAKAGVKQSSNASFIDHYNAVKLTETDYYPFGMQIGERTSASFTANYRYGFNVKQQDDEVKGIGNEIDYGARVYDTRLGRFLSVDPLMAKFPWLSAYQFSENNPIRFIDLDGAEIFDPLTRWFTTDAAITITTQPTSAKAKIYGAGLGVAGSVTGVGTGVANLAMHPIQSAKGLAKGLWRTATNTPAENAIDYGLNMYQNYGELPEPVQDYAIYGHFAGDVMMLASSFKGISKSGSAVAATTISEEAAELLGARQQLAKSWGIYADYVDFSKKVYNETQAQGQVLYQYRIPGTKAGSYYVKSLNISPEEVGLSSSGYTEVYKVTVTKSTKSLITTHLEDAKYWRDEKTTVPGGGQQIFSPELKNNATFEKVPSNGN